MKNSQHLLRWLILCTCLASSFTVAANQEGIVVDANGDYVITYQSYAGLWQKVTWIPATKINPAVKWAVGPTETKTDNFVYSYTLRNNKDSRQALVGMRLSARNALSSDPIQPAGWAGNISLDRTSGAGFIVGWFFRRYDGHWQAGLRPGATEGRFGFDSKDLPGVGKVALRGATPGGQGFPDEGPRRDTPIYEEFNRINDNDFVTRLAAVPRVSVPVPYDAAGLLKGIQKHIKDDLASLQLIESALVTQLDPWFASAIDAAKRNNSEGLRHAIKGLRRLLKQEHADVDKDDGGDSDDDDKEKRIESRIDKLAARVLDFDLRYVEKRDKGEKD